MRSTFATDQAIVEVLKEAQAPILITPFAIDPEIKIRNYQPVELGIDTVSIDEGVFVYFEDTTFLKSNAGGNSLGHMPDLNIDIYISKKALKKESGDLSYSVERADLEMRSVAIQLFEALKHTEFLRLVNTKIEENPTVNNKVRCSEIYINKAQKLGVLKLPQSSKAVCVFRFKLNLNVNELVGTNAGAPFLGTDDHVNPYIKAEDLEK